MCNNSPRLNHLTSADNTIFLCDGRKRYFKLIFDFVHRYAAISDKHIKKKKSSFSLKHKSVLS